MHANIIITRKQVEEELRKLRSEYQRASLECAALRAEKDAYLRSNSQHLAECERLRSEYEGSKSEVAAFRAERDAARQQLMSVRAGASCCAHVRVCMYTCM